MDKIVLRTSDFMDAVKNLTSTWVEQNASPLQSIDDRLKLVASGNYIEPVHIYVSIDAQLDPKQAGLIQSYKRAASEAYAVLEKRLRVISDEAPSPIQKPLPEQRAMAYVKGLVAEWLDTEYSNLKHLRGWVSVMHRDSRKQIDFFVPYGTELPKHDGKNLLDLRTRARRLYAEVLAHDGIGPELPVASVMAKTQISHRYVHPLSNHVH